MLGPWLGYDLLTGLNSFGASFGPPLGHDITAPSKHNFSPSCGRYDARIPWPYDQHNSEHELPIINIVYCLAAYNFLQ
jgi:hypothetical protein